MFSLRSLSSSGCLACNSSRAEDVDSSEARRTESWNENLCRAPDIACRTLEATRR